MKNYIKRYRKKGVEYAYFRPSAAMRKAGITPVRLPTESAERDVVTLLEKARYAISPEGSVFIAEEQERQSRHVKRIVASASKRARLRGRDFTITLDYVLELLHRQQYRCSVTAIPFDMRDGDSYHAPWRPSIDRINAKAGYTPDNIQLVCLAVNTARSDWGDAVFWRVVAAAYAHGQNQLLRSTAQSSQSAQALADEKISILESIADYRKLAAGERLL